MDQWLMDVKEATSSFNELSKKYRDLEKNMQQCLTETRNLKTLIGKPGETSLKDSWLFKAGLALIAFPDPTITDLVGSIMVTAGIIKYKIRRLTVADISNDLQEAVKSIQEFAGLIESQ